MSNDMNLDKCFLSVDRLNMRLPALVLLISAVLSVAGCSNSSSVSTGEVRGRVTEKGQPVAGVSVVFYPDAGRPSYGSSDADGNFVLEYDEKTLGAVVGSHTVTMSYGGFGPPSADESEPTMRPTRTAGGANGEPIDVTLPDKVEVVAGENNIELSIP